MATITAAPRLREQLPKLPAGRAVVIDYFTSARCGVVVGDITARFRPVPPPGTYVRLDDLEGVPVFARARLLPLLAETSVDLDLHRLPLSRGLAVRLERPELWLEFLERPGVAARAGDARDRR